MHLFQKKHKQALLYLAVICLSSSRKKMISENADAHVHQWLRALCHTLLHWQHYHG